MQLGISSLAWSPLDDNFVAEVALAHGLEFVDIAPSKYFDGTYSASAVQLERIRRFWTDNGLPVRALQSLFFGLDGLSIFGDLYSQNVLLKHLERVSSIGATLGAEVLVFGSPKNRDRGTLNYSEAELVAVDFFRRAGDVVARHGMVLCLEPNPTRYGCNFMTDVASTMRVVRAVRHEAIALNFDVGSVHINREIPKEALAVANCHIRHAHISETDLLPLGVSGVDHRSMGEAFNGAKIKAAAIEVLHPNGQEIRDWLPHTLALAARYYRMLKS